MRTLVSTRTDNLSPSTGCLPRRLPLKRASPRHHMSNRLVLGGLARVHQGDRRNKCRTVLAQPLVERAFARHHSRSPRHPPPWPGLQAADEDFVVADEREVVQVAEVPPLRRALELLWCSADHDHDGLTGPADRFRLLQHQVAKGPIPVFRSVVLEAPQHITVKAAPFRRHRRTTESYRRLAGAACACDDEQRRPGVHERADDRNLGGQGLTLDLCGLGSSRGSGAGPSRS
jgi:hypothetical protein